MVIGLQIKKLHRGSIGGDGTSAILQFQDLDGFLATLILDGFLTTSILRWFFHFEFLIEL